MNIKKQSIFLTKGDLNNIKYGFCKLIIAVHKF